MIRFFKHLPVSIFDYHKLTEFVYVSLDCLIFHKAKIFSFELLVIWEYNIIEADSHCLANFLNITVFFIKKLSNLIDVCRKFTWQPVASLCISSMETWSDGLA